MKSESPRPPSDNLSYFAAAAWQHAAGPPPELERTVTVDTAHGSLYIRDDDTIIRPYIEEHGIWAPEQTGLVRETLRPGMRFIDVGAHVGYFSVLAGKLVGPDGIVFAFEPHPRNFELLMANVWRNGLTNVLCFPWAVSDSFGFADLFEARGNSGDHRLYRDEEQRASLRVRTVSLDGLQALRAPVDFVKIDVQGAEPAVIRGMEELLSASPHATVALEYWPFGMERFGTDIDGVLAYYRRARLRRLGSPPGSRSSRGPQRYGD